ncbi:MAG: type II CAAX endopeptidase family protein [Microbacterium sp.]|uniref:CPBP family glutamic-type intramembrane protease n=1 Tax=Microbacterium sp. TaxID=51671 RepID=UPI0039E4B390
MGARAMRGTAEREFAGAMVSARRPTGILLGTIVAIALTALLFQLGPLIRFLIPADVLAAAGVAGVAPAFLSTWLLLWLWLRLKERRPFATIGFAVRPSGARIALRVLRGVGIALAQFAVYLAVGFAAGALTFGEAPTGGILNLPALGWVAVALVAFAVQSGAEEIIARGYLVQVWYPKTGIVGALVVSAVYFTTAHSFSDEFILLPIVDMTLYSVLAVFWALTERGLWGIIAYHATWNWVQGSLFGVAVSGTEPPDSLLAVYTAPDAADALTGGDYGAEGSIVDIAVLLVLIAGAIVAWRRTASAGRTS